MEHPYIVPYNPLAWANIQKLKYLKQQLAILMPALETAQQKYECIKQQADNLSAEIWLLSQPTPKGWAAYYNSPEEYEQYFLSEHRILRKPRKV